MSLSCVSASAWRSEPGPLSFPLVTVIVVAGRFPSAVVRCASAKGSGSRPAVKGGKARLEEDALQWGFMCSFITWIERSVSSLSIKATGAAVGQGEA